MCGDRATTLAQTGAAAFDRAARLHDAEEAGITRFKYAGPPADRPFCQVRLKEAAGGVTYSIEEMRRLSNGQGLPVELYCGGYNCRHQWLPVVEEQTALFSMPAFDAARRQYEQLEMQRHVPAAASHLSDEERLVIFEWTRDKDVSDTFRRVNRALFQQTPLSPFEQQFAEALNAALRRLPPYEAEVVYRGTSFKAVPDLDKYTVGAEVLWRGFAATSKDAARAFTRPGVDVRLVVLHRGARDIEALSANGSIRGQGPENEREVLIPSGARLVVLERNEEASGIVEIVLQEIDAATSG